MNETLSVPFLCSICANSLAFIQHIPIFTFVKYFKRNGLDLFMKIDISSKLIIHLTQNKATQLKKTLLAKYLFYKSGILG